MRTTGSPVELEHRRQLAVQRYLEGHSADEIAECLGISVRSAWRWLASFRDRGPEGVKARPVPGRPPKLTVTQEKIVLRWLRGSPVEHGFATALWTAPRLAQLIEEEFAIRFNPRSLAAGLRGRGFTPQTPERVPRARDPGAIAAWLASDWPRIKRKARRQGAHLALIDESGLLMAPLARRTGAATGPNAVPHPGRRAPQEGLRRGGAVAGPAPGPPGVVLPHGGRRLLRQLVRDGLPGGDVARRGGPVRGHLGWRHPAQG